MKTKIIIALTIISLIGISSCDKDDPEYDLSSVVIVDYNIFEATTWNADSLYVVPNSIKVDALLTIEPGTIIKFHPGSGLEVWENGTISALGSSTDGIVFTSIKDDIGGDTNEDESGTSPDAGDWVNIDLGNQNGSQFIYCTFSYGGNSSYFGTLNLGSNYSKVDNCTFKNNDAYLSGGVYYGALAAQDAGDDCIITNNIFYNNKVPISIDGHISINKSNKFSNPSDATQINKYNGIFVHGQDIISSSTTWQETEVAYVIQYSGFELWDGFSLTLGDSVTLKFFTGGELDIQTGATLANGQGTEVYFTSFKDDNLKGDTNGDGTPGATPGANEWHGIYDGTSFHTWSNILYSSNSY